MFSRQKEFTYLTERKVPVKLTVIEEGFLEKQQRVVAELIQLLLFFVYDTTMMFKLNVFHSGKRPEYKFDLSNHFIAAFLHQVRMTVAAAGC